jgi:hypothetical protein
MKSVYLVAALVAGFSTHAQEAKVLKTSGKRALIEFPGGTPIKPGQTVRVGSSDELSLDGPSSSSSSSSSMAPVGRRNNSIGGSATLSTMSMSGGNASTNSTTIQVTGQYGWNQKKYEYGPEASFSSTSVAGTSVSVFSVGAFFDYNLVPNEAGTKLTYGPGASFDIGSTSGGGSSGTTMALFAGGNVKWWPLGNSVAVRGDAGFDYTRTPAGSATVTGTGLLAKGGFEIYY